MRSVAPRHAGAASDRRGFADTSGLAAPHWPEQVFVTIVLILSMGAGFSLLGAQTGDEVDLAAGDPIHQRIWAIVYVVSIVLIARDPQRARLVFTSSAVIPLLAGIVLASTLWSINPPITFRRAVEFLGTTLFAYYLVMRFPLEQLARLLAIAFSIAIVLSFAVGVAKPDIGRMVGGSYDGAWRGICDDKNLLGQAMAMSAFTLLTAMPPRPKPIQALLWCFIGAAALLTILSQSMTSLVVLALTCVLYASTRVARLSASDLAATSLVAYVIVIALAAVIATLGISSVLDTVGRDATFTGREGVWEMALDAIGAKPWLGYGYGAFWAEDRGLAQFIATAEGWSAAHAHNGLLELSLDIGLVGVAIFLVAYLSAFRRAFIYFQRHKDSVSAWPMLFLCYLFSSSITESGIARFNDVKWILFTCVCLYMASAREIRRS